MKRVLHVIDHLDLGGAQSVLVDLVTLMDRSRWHCEVAAMHGHGLFATVLEERGIKVHSLSPSLWPPSYLRAFAHLQSQFDLFHFHLSGANWLAKPLAALLGDQPRVVHDHASADLKFRGVLPTMVDAVFHRFSSHTIAVSPEIKNFLIDYEALDPASVSVILNGIDTTQFSPCSLEEKKEARAFFQLPQEDKIIGTVGRLASEKNQALFLKAAAQALNQGLRAIFVIAGTGPEESSLRNLAQQLGIDHAVRFLGQVQHRVALYRALDLFVLTSRYEGLPMVLLEAMASGVPVASSDLEGIHRALDGGMHGVLFPSDDVVALTQCLLRADNEVQSRLAVSARQKVERDFSAQVAAEKLGECYQSLF